MRHYITFILLGINAICSAQIDSIAEKKDVNGIILYRFIPDNKFADYYCSLKTKIIVDSMTYDFVPRNDANHSIIRENKQLEKTLGVADSFLTGNIETNLCVYRPNEKRLEKYDCDPFISVYRENNVYDSLLFKPDLEKHMTLRLFSDAIYSKKSNDTIYIALQFYGTVIRYDNIKYGQQKDSRIFYSDDGTKEFDDSHSLCPFEKYDSTVIVLNRVHRLEKINPERQRQLELKKSELTRIKIFLYE